MTCKTTWLDKMEMTRCHAALAFRLAARPEFAYSPGLERGEPVLCHARGVG
jgi:hypothetical protein